MPDLTWTLAIASGLALLIGVSLGAVGGGGSMLAVPVLVGVAGLGVEAATTGSLVVVGAASLAGVLSMVGTGRVHVAVGGAVGAAGIGGSFVGTRIHELADPDVLLVAFAVLMAVVAVRMALGQSAGRRREPGDVPVTELPDPEPVPRTGPTATWHDGATLRRYVSDPSSAGVAYRTDAPTAERRRSPAERAALVLATGTAVGLLTGTLGVGGGFVIVPALVLVLGLPLADAAATSLLVIAVNSAVALAMRGGVDSVDWSVIAPFTVAAVVGVLVGRRVAERVPTPTLGTALTVLIAAVAVWTGARGVAGLI